MNSKDVVLSFWNAMKTNDFAKACEWLSLDFEGFWPQSGELILGRENFVAINGTILQMVIGYSTFTLLCVKAIAL